MTQIAIGRGKPVSPTCKHRLAPFYSRNHVLYSSNRKKISRMNTRLKIIQAPTKWKNWKSISSDPIFQSRKRREKPEFFGNIGDWLIANYVRLNNTHACVYDSLINSMKKGAGILHLRVSQDDKEKRGTLKAKIFI